MLLTIDTDKSSAITKKEFSVFYDMCVHNAEQSCWCEFVFDEEKQKCFTCEAKEFLKD